MLSLSILHVAHFTSFIFFYWIFVDRSKHTHCTLLWEPFSAHRGYISHRNVMSRWMLVFLAMVQRKKTRGWAGMATEMKKVLDTVSLTWLWLFLRVKIVSKTSEMSQNERRVQMKYEAWSFLYSVGAKPWLSNSIGWSVLL